MNDDKAKKALGNYLKNLRKTNSEKMSASELGERISKSQGYISGVENANRSFPTVDFVTDYLDALAKNDWEFNKYISDINSLPGVDLPIEKREVTDFEEDQSMLAAFSATSPNIMTHFDKQGISYDEYYDFPINDINYHLTDTDNKKYFRKIELDDNDREYIDTFINGYMVNKLKIQIQTIKTRYANGQVDKEVHDRYTKETQELIDKLLDSDGLQY